MTAKMIFGAILAIGLATSANATVTVAPVAGGLGIERVAEGCGPGFWRGPNGVCHHAGAYGAGVVRPCPPGMHLGAEGHRCWPN